MSTSPLEKLLGRSPAMERVRHFVARAAQVEVPVLLVGETGTGKGLIARRLHRASRRAPGPFVVVNCAGIPDALFESELFGHRRGAFTGAVDSRPGLFQAAKGGTLLLDELGELQLRQQAKLLTVLEDREVRRVGDERPVAVDARVVSATSRDLAAALSDGSFRRDLFHRVAVLACLVPPLRERPGDVELLARHFLRVLSRKHRLGSVGFGPGAVDLLRGQRWPGNVRELAHVVEAALILSAGKVVLVEHLRDALAPLAGVGAGDGSRPDPEGRRARSQEESESGPDPAESSRRRAPGQRAPGGRPEPSPPASHPPPGGRNGERGPTGLDPVRGPGADGGPQRGLPPPVDGAADPTPRAGGPAPRYSFFGAPEEEREMIRGALARCRGNRTRAARELGMSRGTLRKRIEDYGL